MKNKKILLAVLALVVIAGLMLGIYMVTSETTLFGNKKITVTVVHGDKSEKTFTYYTDADYLGDVLTGEKLVEGEQGAYGLYIKVVDGERAVYELDKAYWAIYIGEESAMTGADQIVIHDGDSFQLVYTGA